MSERDKADELAGLNRLVRMLGGWPKHFRTDERRHGLALLGQLRRDQVLDETVFGMVTRYALHRAAFDRFATKIKKAATGGDATDDDQKPSAAGGFLSGDEQHLAYHENRLLTLERELLATPYARVRSGSSAQTSFMAELVQAPKDFGADNKVTPFKPMGRHQGRRA